MDFLDTEKQKTIKSIDTIKSLITNKDKEISEINFMKDCLIEKLMSEIKKITVYPWSYKIKFYDSLSAYIKRKEYPLPKTEKEIEEKFGKYNPKICYEMAFDNLKSMFPTIKEITQVVYYGWNTSGVELYFTLTNDTSTYYFFIPIIDNISRSDIVRESFDQYYIDYDVAKFRLAKQTSRNCWEYLWQGYDVDEAKNIIGKENEDDI